MTNYIYTTLEGREVEVWIKEDCGIVTGLDKAWRKVICKPIGFNNCPNMILDFDKLKPMQGG
jgi:hypothetical protein